MAPEFWLLLRIVLSLVVVLALAVVALRFVLPQMVRPGRGRSSSIEIVEVALLDRQSKLALVRVKGRELLVGFGAGQGVRALSSWASEPPSSERPLSRSEDRQLPEEVPCR